MCNSCKCSCKFYKIPHIFCDTLYVASVAEIWLPYIKFTGATLALVACNFSYTLQQYNISRHNNFEQKKITKEIHKYYTMNKLQCQ